MSVDVGFGSLCLSNSGCASSDDIRFEKSSPNRSPTKKGWLRIDLRTEFWTRELGRKVASTVSISHPRNQCGLYFRRVLCKFFAHGACLKGEHCEYAHDWKAPPNNVCTFYQRGACSYGSRCRYDHVKVSHPQSSASFSASSSASLSVLSGGPQIEISSSTGAPAELSASSRAFVYQPKPKATGSYNLVNQDNESARVEAADVVLCSFAAAGNCPRGDKCPHVHGDLCPTCGKHCLDPFKPEEREEHAKTCEKRQKNLEALKHSQEIECSVCLERVLSKPMPAERKFGILSECDHPFCIACIRNWRSNSPSSGLDVNSALRACPICRKLSYFVIPSVIWYSSTEQKKEIVDNYKAKLKSIDCRYFDFGNGNCPFGTSCFYKHKVKPGSFLWRNPHMKKRSLRARTFIDDDFEFTEQDAAALDELADEFAELMFSSLFQEPIGSSSGGYSEELLSAQQKKYLRQMRGLDMDGPGEEESLSPKERRFLMAMLGHDITEMDEEDLLTPWERSFMYSQLGYDMDDMVDYLGNDDDEYDDEDFGDEEDDFGDDDDEC